MPTASPAVHTRPAPTAGDQWIAPTVDIVHMPEPLPPSETPLPSPTTRAGALVATGTPSIRPTLGSSVKVHEDSLTLLVYPFQDFWRTELDRTYNISYSRFEAGAYDSAPRVPVEKKFKTILVENEYLRLTFLPELGGRLYQVLFKPTGQTLFYNNHVLKPTPWGPEQQGGWVAAGGLEWALPVNEHGYEWGIPWSYTIASAPDQVSVTLQDSESRGRVRAQVSVTLHAGSAYFVVHPRVINGTSTTIPIQFWDNAMLALNDRNVSPETEFILRGAEVFVHSTGSDFVPKANVPAAGAAGPANPVPWPVIGGRDLSRYKNWQEYLGVFLTSSGVDFDGAYNHANDLGLVRVFPRDRVRGVKLFAWGPNFSGHALFGDDGSDYFELWGGLAPTFYSYQEWPFTPGETREWDEYWIPLSHTDGAAAASPQVVLNLLAETGSRITVIAAATTRGTRGTLVLARENLEVKRWNVSLDPGRVWRETVDAAGSGSTVPPSGRLKLQFKSTDGKLLAETP